MRKYKKLINKISNENIKKYMEESYVCLRKKAYRGSILMSTLALFYDLVDKFDEMAVFNNSAKDIMNEINAKKRDGKNFENYFVDKISSGSFLPAERVDVVRRIKDIRNRVAHPTEHMSSYEEAVYIFKEVIDKFLSESKLYSRVLVGDIVIRLDHASFFTYKQEDYDCYKEIVNSEIELIHSEANDFLISKIARKIDEQTDKAVNNFSRFIYGYVNGCEEDRKSIVIRKIVEKKITDNDYLAFFHVLFTINPSFIEVENGALQIRIKSIIEQFLKGIDHSYDFLKKILSYAKYSHIADSYKDKICELIGKETFLEFWITVLSFTWNRKFKSIFVDKLKEKLSSSQFDIVNPAVSFLKYQDESISKLISEEEAFEIIVIIYGANRRNAWGAQEVVKERYNLISFIKNRAMQVVNDSALSRSIYENKEPYGNYERFMESINLVAE